MCRNLLLVAALLALSGSLLVSGQFQTEGTIRLNNDGDRSRRNSGRLEIFALGVWGTICDDLFGLTEATVACRQLGYPTGALFYDDVGSLRFSAGSGTILVDDIDCSSTSQTIAQCSRRSYGIHNCAHSEDIALVCIGEGTVRLAPNSGQFGTSTVSTSSGRLEIYAGGQWGTVCDDSFGQTDANIACNQLGFPYANSNGRTFNSFSTLPILLDDVLCFSSFDDYLLECSHRGIGVHNCIHSEDVELSCSLLPLSNIVAIGVGASVGIVVLIIIVSIVCCCCCFCITKSSSSSLRSRQVVVQPQAHTTTAYPMQVNPTQTAYVAQAAPLQQYPQAAAPYPTTPQNVYAQQPAPQYDQQPYPTGGYPAGPYPPQQQPAPYPTGGQAPPAPYPSDVAPPSAYPPGPSDLSTYKDPPPAYGDFPSAPPQ